MGGSATELTGPDFGAGITIDAIPEGAMQLGHADGEAILLVRKGGEFFAVGANCTHYGAPLAEGVVEGDEVRCPWHHACFDLRTGSATSAPALNDLPCYEVERRGDRLVVLGKKTKSAATAMREPLPQRIVVLGAGAAGAAAVEMLRREGFEGSIALVGAQSSVPVDLPNLSKDYLAGNAPEE